MKWLALHCASAAHHEGMFLSGYTSFVKESNCSVYSRSAGASLSMYHLMCELSSNSDKALLSYVTKFFVLWHICSLCFYVKAGKRAAMTRLRVSRDKYKFKWDNMKRTGIASPYFHNSYIYIKIMLITSPKRTPLIKSSNMST